VQFATIIIISDRKAILSPASLIQCRSSPRATRLAWKRGLYALRLMRFLNGDTRKLVRDPCDGRDLWYPNSVVCPVEKSAIYENEDYQQSLKAKIPTHTHIVEFPCNAEYPFMAQNKKWDGIRDDPFQIANPAKGWAIELKIELRISFTSIGDIFSVETRRSRIPRVVTTPSRHSGLGVVTMYGSANTRPFETLHSVLSRPTISPVF